VEADPASGAEHVDGRSRVRYIVALDGLHCRHALAAKLQSHFSR
jgi:hypothetical protein